MSTPLANRNGEHDETIVCVAQPFKLGVHAIRSLDAEANRATDELSRLRDMLESEEDY